MGTEVLVDEDMHVHSTFSDGRDSVQDNVAQAESLGLRRLACVDHVRRDTTWIPEFVATVARAGACSSVTVLCGVEAKILDAAGTLDVPDRLDGVDLVYAADHQFPLGSRCYRPVEIRDMLASGGVNADALIAELLRALRGVLTRYRRVVLAHLFSILPRVGLSELEVPDGALATLAGLARKHGAMIEIDERWHCPSARVAQAFRSAGVPVLASSDSHRRETIGQYRFVKATLGALSVGDAYV